MGGPSAGNDGMGNPVFGRVISADGSRVRRLIERVQFCGSIRIQQFKRLLLA